MVLIVLLFFGLSFWPSEQSELIASATVETDDVEFILDREEDGRISIPFGQISSLNNKNLPGIAKCFRNIDLKPPQGSTISYTTGQGAGLTIFMKSPSQGPSININDKLVEEVAIKINDSCPWSGRLRLPISGSLHIGYDGSGANLSPIFSGEIKLFGRSANHLGLVPGFIIRGLRVEANALYLAETFSLPAGAVIPGAIVERRDEGQPRDIKYKKNSPRLGSPILNCTRLDAAAREEPEIGQTSFKSSSWKGLSVINFERSGNTKSISVFASTRADYVCIALPPNVAVEGPGHVPQVDAFSLGLEERLIGDPSSRIFYATIAGLIALFGFVTQIFAFAPRVPKPKTDQ